MPIGITNGPVEIDIPAVPTFYESQRADYKARNGYLRIPGGLDLTEPQTFVVFLHGDTPETNAGLCLDGLIGGWFDAYGGLSWYPTSLVNGMNSGHWTQPEGPVNSIDEALRVTRFTPRCGAWHGDFGMTLIPGQIVWDKP